ncbi:hypothetical protein ANOM_002085 [Aspergillus nomiae NRRL 13137]|uniref:Leucine-rich repeat domain-containing protein n=1 Tax=Aspergillus nomiae NRRL (strain ATCC 15546 / NRRL 13137 / CBS 260.88 / M93) TaxID=1509407 RepID=A0A0L1JE70_ASPN3|nr:uncharacterized protein ANOM_002085 [Aspergillus nomiae NRRL 13137]KNG90099.1 hypothetical protein ANOM_002085 [Aspergillus nomiae NRRL 13137]
MDRLPNELLLLLGQYIDDDPFTKLVLSNCSRRLQSLFNSPRTCRWAAHLREFSDEAWLGVLLTRLNNLKSITLAYGDEEFMNSIFDKAALRQAPFRTTTPFSFLQKVTLRSHFSLFQHTSGYSTGLFYLPAVRTMEGVGLWESFPRSGKWNFRGVTGRMSLVTELVMSPVYGCRGLGEWIEACSKLERLQVDIGIMECVNYIFDPIGFRTCLVPCMKTLKDLCLRFHISYKEDRALRRGEEIYLHLLRDDFPLGSFREFYVLEHLSMRHANLVQLPNTNIEDRYGAAPQSLLDLLPASLKSLEITDVVHIYFPELVSALEELVRLHVTFMPEFERLVLYLQGDDVGPAEATLVDHLTTVCERMWVCLTVKDDPFCTSIDMAESTHRRGSLAEAGTGLWGGLIIAG